MKLILMRLALAVLAFSASALVARAVVEASATSSQVPLLTAGELEYLRISSPPASSLLEQDSWVSNEQAVATARDIVGDLPIEGVVTGIAAQYEDSSDYARPVFVVVFAGGQVPIDAPDEAGGPVVARLTGIVVDASTGEFLRGFMLP
jgi:phage shock protein PspC (stress-responsive transcriptional regulator)